ncbi:hypothetical protein AYI68_g804 [Smittium mucronatum]|uniref:Uncharacterized protein n=1 Tax=Smittium mucronatum TaxID=133383 RepID=A0A1R0H7F3_9FUNG|nr:hypothetical protein AYI68_g804 [Smittium mucronatum]
MLSTNPCLLSIKSKATCQTSDVLFVPIFSRLSSLKTVKSLSVSETNTSHEIDSHPIDCPLTVARLSFVDSSDLHQIIHYNQLLENRSQLRLFDDVSVFHFQNSLFSPSSSEDSDTSTLCDSDSMSYQVSEMSQDLDFSYQDQDSGNCSFDSNSLHEITSSSLHAYDRLYPDPKGTCWSNSNPKQINLTHKIQRPALRHRTPSAGYRIFAIETLMIKNYKISYHLKDRLIEPNPRALSPNHS